MVVNKKGFTIFEMVVVLGILLSSSLILLPIGIGQLQRNKVENVAKDLASRIFLYQQNANSGLGNESYGISFANNSYTLYTGDSLGSAVDSAEIPITSNIQISNISITGGGNEIHFDKNTFKPVNDGTITLSDSANSYNIVINQEGMIYVENI